MDRLDDFEMDENNILELRLNSIEFDLIYGIKLVSKQIDEFYLKNLDIYSSIVNDIFNAKNMNFLYKLHPLPDKRILNYAN